ncbi:MAG: NUDIX domain-containing protein [Myxococcota bacterium]
MADGGPRVVDVEFVQDLTRESAPDAGYLRRRRVRAKSVLSDGRRTAPYVVDWVERAPGKEDAVGICVHADIDGQRWVLLRRQLRVAQHVAIGEPLSLEIVAGVIEPGRSVEEMAVIEAHEEAGLRLSVGDIRPLGQPMFPVIASFSEQIHIVEAEVPASAFEHLDTPPTDGSPMEEGADLWLGRLDEALRLAYCAPRERDDGLFLADAKTEIALFRLRDRLEGR